MKNVEVVFTGLKGPVRDTINRSKLIDKIGINHCFMSIQEAVDCYESMFNEELIEKKFQKYIKQSNK
jgi:SulP family sulfate permease